MTLVGATQTEDTKKPKDTKVGAAHTEDPKEPKDTKGCIGPQTRPLHSIP